MTPITALARIVHEANKALCEALGDNSQKPWNEAEAWQRAAAIDGVKHALANPNDPVSRAHEFWCEAKLKDGWVYGEIKDGVAKTHPCLVPYAQLPEGQKAKDALLQAVVTALTPLYNEMVAEEAKQGATGVKA